MSREVWSKLDWYSVVLYNYTIDRILDKLTIKYDVFEELLEEPHERSQGFSSIFVWHFNGICLELNYDDYVNTDNTRLFDTVFKKIRLDISGSGLDYLRSREIKFLPDKEFVKEDFWGVNQRDYNITRCDFAFDFVNINSSFLDDTLYWIQCKERNGDLIQRDSRLYVGNKRGIQYSYRCGAHQKTLYLGSPRGDKMVRIYDKKLEQTDAYGNWKQRDERFKDCGVINSWFRIELQSRRKCATQFLFSCAGDIRNVLRAIFDQYLIRDENGVPLPAMVDLYDWESLPNIQLNLNFIQFRGKVIDNAERFIKGSAWRSIYLYILRYGINDFIRMLNDEMMKCFNSQSMISHRRYLGFINKFAIMMYEEELSEEDLKGKNNKMSDNFGCPILNLKL